jgi:hypothetical protein
MSNPWSLFVDRHDLKMAAVEPTPIPDLADGQALLKVDRVGMTANNVTYALMGEAMRSWQFFPADEQRGRVPLWGFATVEASKSDGLREGERFYGYLPPSSHLLVEPASLTEFGFKDASAHRQPLPKPYNVYQATATDPAYEPKDEDLQILYRPLFITSFVLDDFFDDNDEFGAEALIYSSASSKTAYGTAFCAQRRGSKATRIGLTSPRNLEFTRSLDCYDEVLTYEQIEELDRGTPTAYLDMAGSLETRRAIHSHLESALKHDAVVGATHLQGPPAPDAAEVPGVRPRFFFAPDQISKRREDWGPRGVEDRFGAAWKDFVPVVAGWVEVVESAGPEGLKAAWLEVLSGESDPRKGRVIAL